jgi:hypothetical protein
MHASKEARSAKLRRLSAARRALDTAHKPAGNRKSHGTQFDPFDQLCRWYSAKVAGVTSEGTTLASMPVLAAAESARPAGRGYRKAPPYPLKPFRPNVGDISSAFSRSGRQVTAFSTWSIVLSSLYSG